MTTADRRLQSLIVSWALLEADKMIRRRRADSIRARGSKAPQKKQAVYINAIEPSCPLNLLQLGGVHIWRKEIKSFQEQRDLAKEEAVRRGL